MPADAQMTSLGTSLSPAEITNGDQPRVPAAPGSHNSFLGFAEDSESRHPVLPPWPSLSEPVHTLLLSAFLKQNTVRVLSSPNRVLGNSVIIDTGQALLVIHSVSFALLSELVKPNFAHICTLL